MQHLYRFYDSEHRLLYAGITSDLGVRIGQHASDKHWWPEVVRIDVERLETRQQALDAEELAIKREYPRYNVQHNGKSARGWRDDDIPPAGFLRASLKARDGMIAVLKILSDLLDLGVFEGEREDWYEESASNAMAMIYRLNRSLGLALNAGLKEIGWPTA